jgi:cytidine deaminase
MKKTLLTEYELHDDAATLAPVDAELLQEARSHTYLSYAPYSHFHVAAAARLHDGTLVYGANQENASYPVGICAERTLLSTISSQFPESSTEAIAISYSNDESDGSNHPVSPCGLCRQTLLEYEQRWGKPIRLILAGQTGKVLVVNSAADILPFSFTSADMKAPPSSSTLK